MWQYSDDSLRPLFRLADGWDSGQQAQHQEAGAQGQELATPAGMRDKRPGFEKNPGLLSRRKGCLMYDRAFIQVHNKKA